jgi:hypothetical protein
MDDRGTFIRFRDGEKVFVDWPDRLWGPPSLLLSGSLGLFLRGCEANPSVQRRRMCGAIPVLRHALSYSCGLLRHLAASLVSFLFISMFRKQARPKEGEGVAADPPSQNLNRTGNVL